MRERPFNLAIETSDRQGWITLGRGHDLIESLMIHPASAPSAAGLSPRRGDDLMPAIESLCQRHDVQPRDIGELYVSLGPGSFTGLRVAIATAKMLARFLETRVIGVPTIEVIAHQVPTDTHPGHHLAIALNHKRKTAYTQVFASKDNRWQPLADATVMTLAALFEEESRPLLLVSPAMPKDIELPATVTLLPASIAQPHSDTVWLLGQQAARQGRFTDVRKLLPIYARPPEAVELWNQREAQASK